MSGIPDFSEVELDPVRTDPASEAELEALLEANRDPDGDEVHWETPEGITLDDCETASHLADGILEGDEEIPGAYLLEVESPGLDRPLWTLDDCRRFAGRRVRLTTNEPVDGAKRMKGPLEAVDGDALILMDEDRKRRYTVRFGDVKVVRLIPEF